MNALLDILALPGVPFVRFTDWLMRIAPNDTRRLERVRLIQAYTRADRS